MKKKELKELIEQGEGYFVEFKEQIGVGLDKEMVAFANASGGKIVIGVTDRGKIIGCTTDNTVRSKIQDIANNCDLLIPKQRYLIGRILRLIYFLTMKMHFAFYSSTSNLST